MEATDQTGSVLNLGFSIASILVFVLFPTNTNVILPICCWKGRTLQLFATSSIKKSIIYQGSLNIWEPCNNEGKLASAVIWLTHFVFGGGCSLYIPTYLPTHLPTYIHTCIDAWMHRCMDAEMHRCIHASKQANMHACICPSIHPNIHPCMHTYIHA